MIELRKTLPSQEVGSWLWPNVYTTRGAEEAIKLRFFAALCVCVSITGLTLLAALGVDPVQKLGVDAIFFLEGLIYGAIALGIWQHSRTAAWAGLLLFTLARALNWYRLGVGDIGLTLVLMGILVVAFIGGIRGTAAWHRLKTSKNLAPPDEDRCLVTTMKDN